MTASIEQPEHELLPAQLHVLPKGLLERVFERPFSSNHTRVRFESTSHARHRRSFANAEANSSIAFLGLRKLGWKVLCGCAGGLVSRRWESPPRRDARTQPPRLSLRGRGCWATCIRTLYAIRRMFVRCEFRKRVVWCCSRKTVEFMKALRADMTKTVDAAPRNSAGHRIPPGVAAALARGLHSPLILADLGRLP
jgi:hypothetical protein